MIVVNRFRVTDESGLAFHAAAEPAMDLLRTKSGLRSADLVQNLDDPGLWVLVTAWENVGAYRRALGGYESKLTLVPFLSLSLDEPSAYASPDDVGENVPRVR